MKKLFNAIYWLVLAVVLLFAGSLFFSRGNAPTSYRVYSVNSGSMEPKIPLGSLVFIKSQKEYQEGDVITFKSEANANVTVTHRIAKVEKDEDIGKFGYQTKGDANEDADPELVNPLRVIGRVIFSIPLLGYGVTFAKTQIGFGLLIVIPATLIIYSEIGNIKKEIKKMMKNKKEEKEDEEKL